MIKANSKDSTPQMLQTICPGRNHAKSYLFTRTNKNGKPSIFCPQTDTITSLKCPIHGYRCTKTNQDCCVCKIIFEENASMLVHSSTDLPELTAIQYCHAQCFFGRRREKCASFTTMCPRCKSLIFIKDEIVKYQGTKWAHYGCPEVNHTITAIEEQRLASLALVLNEEEGSTAENTSLSFETDKTAGFSTGRSDPVQSTKGRVQTVLAQTSPTRGGSCSSSSSSSTSSYTTPPVGQKRSSDAALSSDSQSSVITDSSGATLDFL